MARVGGRKGKASADDQHEFARFRLRPWRLLARTRVEERKRIARIWVGRARAGGEVGAEREKRKK